MFRWGARRCKIEAGHALPISDFGIAQKPSRGSPFCCDNHTAGLDSLSRVQSDGARLHAARLSTQTGCFPVAMRRRVVAGWPPCLAPAGRHCRVRTYETRNGTFGSMCAASGPGKCRREKAERTAQSSQTRNRRLEATGASWFRDREIGRRWCPMSIENGGGPHAICPRRTPQAKTRSGGLPEGTATGRSVDEATVGTH